MRSIWGNKLSGKIDCQTESFIYLPASVLLKNPLFVSIQVFMNTFSPLLIIESIVENYIKQCISTTCLCERNIRKRVILEMKRIILGIHCFLSSALLKVSSQISSWSMCMPLSCSCTKWRNKILQKFNALMVLPQLLLF